MATYEFECPQYVDFSEIDSSPKEGVEIGGFSPDLGNATPILNIQTKNSLRRKVCPTIKGTVSAVQTPVVHLSNTTDSEKRCIAKTSLSKRLSKSESSVNLCARNLNALNHNSNYLSLEHNRSLSESNIRTKAKKCPTTPMCLKRTLYRAKVKKLKSSEELELEKIAELQKQTFRHLRANEIAMKRLKIKMKPCTAQREFNETTGVASNLKVDVLKGNRILGKLNNLKQNISPCGTRKIDLNSIFPTKTEKTEKFMSRLKQFRENSGRLLPENMQWNKLNSNQILDAKSEAHVLSSIKFKHPRNMAHSGLTFFPNQEKMTKCKPFNFCKKMKETSNIAEKEVPIKDQLKMAIPHTCHKLSGKENIPSCSSNSEVKKEKHPKNAPFHIFKGKAI